MKKKCSKKKSKRLSGKSVEVEAGLVHDGEINKCPILFCCVIAFVWRRSQEHTGKRGGGGGDDSSTPVVWFFLGEEEEEEATN